jgi:hypothetical protein
LEPALPRAVGLSFVQSSNLSSGSLPAIPQFILQLLDHSRKIASSRMVCWKGVVFFVEISERTLNGSAVV